MTVVEPKEKVDVVSVATVVAGAGVEPNANPPTLPPNGALVDVVVVPPKPPNANEAVLVVGFGGDPKGNIFLKILISEFN